MEGLPAIPVDRKWYNNKNLPNGKISCYICATVRKEVALYVAPPVILGLISIITFMLGVAIIVPEIAAWLLIAIGLFFAISGLVDSIARSNPRTLAANIGRKEFYGVIFTLFGFMLYMMIHLASRIDQLYDLLLNI